MKRLTHLLGLCVLLAACGGGGGGNGGGGNDNGGGGGGDATCTPESGKLQVTNDNADTVSADAYDVTTAIPLLADADYLLTFAFGSACCSTQSINSLLDNLPKIGKNGLLKKQFRSNTMLHSLISNSSALPYSITGGTFNCPAGGSYNLEINDADNNNQASAGDVITFTFSNCQAVDSSNTRSTLNGQLIARLELVTSNSLDQPPFKATFTHNGFTLQTTDSEGTTTARLDGDITATFDCPTSECLIFEIKAEGANLALAGTDVSGKSYSSRVTNYVTQIEMNDNSQELTFSGNGTLYIDSLGNNAVSFATAASNPFKERNADGYPYAGEEVSTGACNSSVKLTVLDNQNVQVAVDASGDGVYETTNSMTWDNFIQQEQ